MGGSGCHQSDTEVTQAGGELGYWGIDLARVKW